MLMATHTMSQAQPEVRARDTSTSSDSALRSLCKHHITAALFLAQEVGQYR